MMMAMDKHNELPEAVRRGIESQDLSDNLQSRASELVKAKPVLPCLRGRTIHVISEGPEACSVNHAAIQENAHDPFEEGSSLRTYPITCKAEQASSSKPSPSCHAYEAGRSMSYLKDQRHAA
ncbi:hypothetical protein F2Q69_00022435 [Brassica cretica]|uniref:Uncharacterized protein n=1 Tax=Brassica cretica TaxID=69181 RepID=A0A8S9Q3E1_BRACR|nr:hypothetical protein F2Q69_00022435 [Brassica cretica]